MAELQADLARCAAANAIVAGIPGELAGLRNSQGGVIAAQWQSSFVCSSRSSTLRFSAGQYISSAAELKIKRRDVRVALALCANVVRAEGVKCRGFLVTRLEKLGSAPALRKTAPIALERNIRMIKEIALAVTLTAPVTPASADTVQELLQRCNSKDYCDLGICGGYIVGVAEVMLVNDVGQIGFVQRNSPKEQLIRRL